MDLRGKDTNSDIRAVHFADLEELREICIKLGWSIDYIQLQSGSNLTSSTSWNCGQISILRESTTRCIRVIGEPPPRAVTIIIPNMNNRYWCNGQWLHDDQMIIYRSGDELNSISDACGPTTAISMHVPEALLVPAIEKYRSLKPGALGLNASPLVCHRGAIAGLRQLMIDAHKQAGECVLPVSEARLVNNLALLIAYSRKSQMNTLNRMLLRKEQIIRRMDQFLDLNIHCQFSVSDLAAAACVSERTLERIFKTEFDLTPSAYVSSRRLHRAKNEMLRRRSARKSISQIALDSGFTHIGRFSTLFHEKFGLSPSEFRRQRDVHT